MSKFFEGLKKGLEDSIEFEKGTKILHLKSCSYLLYGKYLVLS